MCACGKPSTEESGDCGEGHGPVPCDCTTNPLLDRIDMMLEAVEKRPLMYGGDLNGVEVAWRTLKELQRFGRGKQCDDRKAYAKIAKKYNCGNWTLASKVADEGGDLGEAAYELIRRLKEVEDVHGC